MTTYTWNIAQIEEQKSPTKASDILWI